MDKSKYQYEGMKWLFELELLNHPQVINTLRFNILMVSKSIKEVELLIYRENKSMLVLVDLSWFGRKFSKKRIFTEIHETLSQLLPSFKFRITDDPKIMEMAVERVKKALSGGTNENASNSNNSTSNDSSSPVSGPATKIETDRGVSDSQPSVEESSKTSETVRQSIGPDDSSKK
jgi:hypothetical protein